jgi:hypothetical protein
MARSGLEVRGGWAGRGLLTARNPDGFMVVLWFRVPRLGNPAVLWSNTRSDSSRGITDYWGLGMLSGGHLLMGEVLGSWCCRASWLALLLSLPLHTGR